MALRRQNGWGYQYNLGEKSIYVSDGSGREAVRP